MYSVTKQKNMGWLWYAMLNGSGILVYSHSIEYQERKDLSSNTTQSYKQH